MDELTQRRLAHNEKVFREVNEGRLLASDPDDGMLTFICECSARGCTERIRLSADDYIAIRRDPRRFVIVPGHEIAEIERVVEEHPGYDVVEKDAA